MSRLNTLHRCNALRLALFFTSTVLVLCCQCAQAKGHEGNHDPLSELVIGHPENHRYSLLEPWEVIASPLSNANTCGSPTNLSLAVDGHTFLELIWNDDDPPGSWYVVQWRESGTLLWESDTLTQATAPVCPCQPCSPPGGNVPPEPRHRLRGLKPCTNYECRVQKICFNGFGNASASPWSDTGQFSTLECGNDYFTSTCFSVAKQPEYAAIAAFHLLDLHDTTGYCSPCGGCTDTTEGYHFLSGFPVVLQKNQVYPFSLEIASGAESVQNGYVRIWIDFNHDHDFNDAGEMVFSSGQASTGTLTGKFFVPLGAATGNTRMRVSFNVSQIPAPCSVFEFGEVNDYTVDIQPASCTGSLTLTGKNISCYGGSNGSVVAGTNGGDPPLSYQWSNGSTASMVTGLLPGTYALTLTNSQGCTITSSYTVLQPPPLFLNIHHTSMAPACNSPTGSVWLQVAGGTPGYQFNWSNGAASKNLAGVSPATYSVIVTDTLGCTATQSATVAMAGCHSAASTDVPIIIPASGTPMVTSSLHLSLPANAVITDVNVNSLEIDHIKISDLVVKLTSPAGTTVTLVSQSCNSPPGFSGMNIGFDDESPIPNTAIPCPPVGQGIYRPLQALAGFKGQNPNGTWTLVIMDVNHLNGGAIAGWSLSVCYSAPTPSLALTGSIPCNGTGIALANVSGGVPGYTFLWNTGATSQTIIGLSNGNYSVTATDAEGCKAFGSITLAPPQPPVLTALVSPAICNSASGAVSLAIEGGKAPFFFSWNNGATTQNITNLPAGNYFVTVIDANGCSATQGATVASSNILGITAAGSNVTCFGANNGSASVSVQVGNGGYTYLWNNGATTANLTNLPLGTYTVTVTDAAGCLATASITLTQPPPLLAEISSTNSDCQTANGTVELSIVGGTPPYFFLWSNGANTKDISQLAPGSYSVTATDANGCSLVQSIQVGQADAPIVLIGNIQAVQCFGGNTGSATAFGSGGQEPYSYQWSNGVITATANGLFTGAYSVTITDANNCTASANAVVTQPPLLVVSASAGNTGCAAPTGSATAVASGGTPPYSFQWSTGATTPTIVNLPAGTYFVTVADSKGCSATHSATVVVSLPLSLVPAATGVTCYGSNDGSAIVFVQSGNGNYSYAWSNGATTQGISNLSAGTYSVTVTDALLCTAVATMLVPQPAAVVAFVSNVQDGSCFGKNDGYVNLSASGGTGTLSFLWNNGSVLEDLFNIAAGIYSVTVTDANGCSETATALVNQPAPLVLLLDATPVGCHNGSDGKLNLSITGGTPPYGTSWTPPSLPNLMSLPAGFYQVTVTDAHGCWQTASATIGEPPPLSIQYDIEFNCNNPAVVTASTQGGLPPYQYFWSNGNIGQTAFLPPGTFGLTVEDSKSCKMVTTVAIPLSMLPQVSLQTAGTSCFGASDGWATATPSGGTPPYSLAWSNGSTTNPAIGLSAGTYAVTLSDARQCTATTTGVVTQPELLSATVAILQGTAMAGATGGTPPYDYLWSNGAVGKEAVFTNIGTYMLTVTDAHGCTATASFDILTALTGVAGLSGFDVFPNPARNELSVRLVANYPVNAALFLEDAYGRLLHQQQFSLGQGLQHLRLDVSGYPPGIYFVKIETKKGTEAKRVIKQ